VAHRLAVLRQDADDLDVVGLVGGDVGGKLTEPVAAIRSPRASVEREQQASAREEIDERSRASFLVRHQEPRGARQRRSVHQNSFTSTGSPASTTSTCAGISM